MLIFFIFFKEKGEVINLSNGIRRRPMLPGRVQPSTFGAEGLNFCVRDGNRWDPFAIATGKFSLYRAFSLSSEPPVFQTQSLLRALSGPAPRAALSQPPLLASASAHPDYRTESHYLSTNL